MFKVLTMELYLEQNNQFVSEFLSGTTIDVVAHRPCYLKKGGLPDSAPQMTLPWKTCFDNYQLIGLVIRSNLTLLLVIFYMNNKESCL